MNNPIRYIDPTGNGTESTHIDDCGNVIAQYDDRDNGVYVHKSGTTPAQIDEQRQGGKYTGGDGNYIGELGGTIDVKKIYSNLLKLHGNKAESGFDYYIDDGETYIRPNAKSIVKEWVNLVKKDGEWDLKDNNCTIFGVAWAFDHDITNGRYGKIKTMFVANGVTGNAADIGNHHAGYTGTKAGIPNYIQFLGAWTIEKLKLEVYGPLFNPLNYFIEPYNDRYVDYQYNKLGMFHARRI